MTIHGMKAGPSTAAMGRSIGDESVTEIQDTESREQSQELSLARPQPPAQIPGYRINRCLGQGAYGSVWLALEEATGKLVAVKFYTHRHGLDWSLLNREVEKLAVLYTSRNIVGLLDVGWDSDPPYYVMEYLENGSLAAYVADGPLPPQEAVRLTRSILLALIHAHGSGILHCDLKPANVLLDADFEPRLCDFGQSRLSDEQNPALGTLFYMAPEQADLNAVPDARWDVYSLGALLYHLLYGEPPYRNSENEQLIRSAATLDERLAVYRRIVKQSPRPDGHRRVRGVDSRLADIVDRCLKIDPERRFPNAQAVFDALELRDRQRSRRPLIALGVVGPLLLLSAMFAFAGNAMISAIESARKNLTERALESDVVSARLLARGVRRDLEDREAEIEQISRDPRLRKAIEAAEAAGWTDRRDIEAVLGEHYRRVRDKRDAQGRERDTSWFLTDREGYQRWRAPLNEYTLDGNWAHRDYFHGQFCEFPRNAVPEDVKPITKPHLSLAFRSQATKRYMMAISVPVWDEQHEEVIGVLARTTHVGQLLAEHESSISGNQGDEISRTMALVDSRDWFLLDHPWMTEENLRDQSDETFARMTLTGRIVEDLERLHQKVDAGKPTAGEERCANYRDPLGTPEFDEEGYGGKWLAAFWPVGRTGWTAIVQERHEAALRPVEEMKADLIQYAVGAIVVSGALIGALWFFVLRALNDRNFRNWMRNSSNRPPGRGSTTFDT